jgi:hypothetical protein
MNGDANNNYRSQEFDWTNGVGPTAHTIGVNSFGRIGRCTAANSAAAMFGAGFVVIPAYTQTTGKKTWLGLSGGPEDAIGSAAGIVGEAEVGYWDSTAAINQLTFSPDFIGGTFLAGSQISLYGLG